MAALTFDDIPAGPPLADGSDVGARAADQSGGAKLRDMYQRGETILEKDRRASTRAAWSAGRAEAAQAPSKALTFDDLTADSKPAEAVKVAKDVGMSAVSGIDKGIAGLAGLPADAALGLDWLLNLGASKITGIPIEQIEAENERDGLISKETVRKFGSEAAHRGSPLYYEPETQAGKTTKNVVEFLPAAALGPTVGLVKRLITWGFAPGAIAELVGNAPGIKDTKAEPFARAGAALVTGGAGAVLTRPSAGARAVQRSTGGVTHQHLDEAEALFDYAQQLGLPITRAEALQHVTEGATGLGNLQRVVEGAGAMRPEMAARPGQVETAGRAAIDTISPPPAAPSAIATDVREAARSAVADTPEGRALADSVWQAGPRMSPADAGAVIQPELHAVQQRREGMRAALADQDYTAAREAPGTIPLDGGAGVRDVTRHYIPDTGRIRNLTDEEIAAEEARRLSDLERVRAERQDRYNVTTPEVVVGIKPTQYGQVDARPVVEHLDEALQTAKGAVAQGLTAARRALMTPEGVVDSSVAGLHSSRRAIKDLIDQAKGARANETVADLLEAQRVLDTALERVPQYGEARRNFQAASKPLEPFGPDRAPGRIVERDQFNQRFEMTPDQVAGVIERGGRAAAQDFNLVAPPAAREAFEQHLITQTIEKVRGKAGDLSAESIRKTLRTNEDVINEFPAVRERLEAVARSRDALEKVLATPIGRLADKDTTTKRAIDALFPANPLPGSSREVGEAVSALAARNPRAARELVRAHVESVFNEATQRLAGGANEFGGAKFAAVLRGNSEQAQSLEAAVKALPRGDVIWDGFERFLNVVEAQGQRHRIGSQTSFNTEILTDLKRGSDAVPIVLGAGVKFPQKVKDAFERWRLGKNVDELAYLLTDPSAARRFRELVEMPRGGDRAAQVAGRLAILAQESSRSRSGKE